MDYLRPNFGQKILRSCFFFILMNGFSFINFVHHLCIRCTSIVHYFSFFGIISVLFFEKFILYRVSRNMDINREVLSMQNINYNHITQDSFNAKKTKRKFGSGGSRIGTNIDRVIYKVCTTSVSRYREPHRRNFVDSLFSLFLSLGCWQL